MEILFARRDADEPREGIHFAGNGHRSIFKVSWIDEQRAVGLHDCFLSQIRFSHLERLGLKLDVFVELAVKP